EKRRIAVQCICTPKFMLEIANPCKEEVLFSKDGLPLSKEKGHGIGTRSIFAFCNKYHASFDFAVSNGQFVLRIVL
ncbi:MAG: GHKL domain-containing protein, partial [Lachnospiraceae bacterium]|nr:GHKL domain-containing protein [Lachnospiraceae bacterium]